MIVLDIQQGTEQWLAAKCGIPSASDFDRIITSSGEPSKQRTKYMHQLAGEVVTGCKEVSYKSADMTRGSEMEAEARYLYELMTDASVYQIGLCYKDEKKLFSCSPDGIVGDNGLIEIKCPTIAVHVGYLVENKLPTEYFQQVQGQLYVTGREWVDFMSYYPTLKPLIVRVKRDEKFIAALDAELKRFCAELEAVVEKIK